MDVAKTKSSNATFGIFLYWDILYIIGIYFIVFIIFVLRIFSFSPVLPLHGDDWHHLWDIFTIFYTPFQFWIEAFLKSTEGQQTLYRSAELTWRRFFVSIRCLSLKPHEHLILTFNIYLMKEFAEYFLNKKSPCCAEQNLRFSNSATTVLSH